MKKIIILCCLAGSFTVFAHDKHHFDKRQEKLFTKLALNDRQQAQMQKLQQQLRQKMQKLQTETKQKRQQIKQQHEAKIAKVLTDEQMKKRAEIINKKRSARDHKTMKKCRHKILD